MIRILIVTSHRLADRIVVMSVGLHSSNLNDGLYAECELVEVECMQQLTYRAVDMTVIRLWIYSKRRLLRRRDNCIGFFVAFLKIQMSAIQNPVAD